MKKTNSILKNIYNNLQLNLGIKSFLKILLKRVELFYDQNILYPTYKKSEKIIFEKIIKHYGADYKWDDEKSQNIDKKTTNHGYGLLHYSIVRSQKPKNILCVGSMYGYIPYMLAKACEDNVLGYVDFVDAGYNIENAQNKETHYFGQGFWKKETIKQHFSYLLNFNFIKTHIMTTKVFAKKYPQKTYDYVYLDGDHSYKGAKTDLKLFWPKLKKNGFIVFHDIHLQESFLKKEARNYGLEFGYQKIWKELIKTKKYKFEMSNQYSGLGFIQKI